MTRSPSSLKSRRSARLCKTGNPVIKAKLQVTKTRRNEKKHVKSIHDFRYLKNRLYYQAYYSDGSSAWVSEETLKDDQEHLQAFQTQVKVKIGLSISDYKSGEFPIDASLTSSSFSRSHRLAKSRACYHLKTVFDNEQHDENSDNENEEDDSDATNCIITENSKRKKRHTRNSVTKKKSRRLTKQELKKQERLERQYQRQSLTVNSDMTCDDHASCCLRCSTRVYRTTLLATQDVEALRHVLEDTKRIPFWHQEDIQFTTDSVFKLAITKGSMDQIVLLAKSTSVNHINAPAKFVEYMDENTRSNMNNHTFRNAIRKVNEMRGNRQGNSAFYREPMPDPLNAEDVRYSSVSTDMTILSLLTNTELVSQPHIVDTLYLARYNGLVGVDIIYYSVASGNYMLAAKIMEDYRHMTWFNHLHYNTLQFVNDEDLELYRRNQVMKMSKETKRLSPLACSAINPSHRYLKELYDTVDDLERYVTDEMGRTIGHFAAASSTSACIEYLIQQNYKALGVGDKFKLTPLIQAARYGRHSNIRPLLQYLSDNQLPAPFHADHSLLKNKCRPLHYAAAYNHSKTCQILIDCGATIDIVDGLDKSTPLMLASARGHLETARCLVENGADPEATDRFGRSPLHLACLHGRTDVVKYLLQVGVDANASDSSLNRPAHYASAFGWLSVLRLLVEYGQADLCAFNVWRTTPLSVANLKGHFAIVQFILANGDEIAVDFKDTRGKTMLHHCITNDISTAMDVEQNTKLLTLILQKGANTNALTNDGDSPLHLLTQSHSFTNYDPAGYVASYGNQAKTMDDMDGLRYQVHVAELLLHHGADINLLDGQGRSPVSYAIQHHNDALVVWFIQNNVPYWNQVTRSGYNFFHYCFRAAAGIDNAVVKVDMDRTRIERMRRGLDQVLETSASHLPSDLSESYLYKSDDHRVTTPVVYGIQNALTQHVETDDRKEEEAFEYFQKLVDYLITHFGLDIGLATKGKECLLLAAERKNVFMFLYLLGKGTDPNEVAHDPQTKSELVLGRVMDCQHNYQHHADKYRQAMYEFYQATLPTWIQHGGDLSTRTSSGLTIIMLVASLGHPGILQLFLETATKTIHENNGVSKLINLVSDSQITALHNCVKALLNVDVRKRDLTCLEYVLEQGGDINHLYSAKKTSIFMKVTHMADLSLMRTVFDKSKHPINHLVINSDGTTALALVIRSKKIDLFNCYFQRLLKDCSRKDISDLINGKIGNLKASCLAAAVHDNQLAVVETLLEHGADCNFGTKYEPAHLFQAIANKNIAVVKALLKAGANVNLKHNMSGDSPLHLAIEIENLDIIKLLLEHGTDVNSTNDKLQTPLHYAINGTMALDVRAFRIERLLLQTGKVNINAVDMLGRTPLHTAFITKDMIPVMHVTDSHKARHKQLKLQQQRKQQRDQMIKDNDKAKRCYEERRSEYVARFDSLSHSWFRQAYDKTHTRDWEETGKMVGTCDEGDEEQIMLSTEELQAIEYCDYYKNWEDGYKTLCQNDPIDVVKFLSSIPGILFDVSDRFGRLPLHYAATVGAFTCTSFFLDEHLDINTEDMDKNTPLHLALLFGRNDYAVMLWNCGAIPMDLCLRSGNKQSIFSFAFSKSYMNLVYLALGKGTNVFEGLQLVLKNGDYYLASMLFQSADDQAILSKTNTTNQNFWHLISNFNPMSRDIWEEYLGQFVERLSKLQVDISLDIYGRTAIHYAAKHKQTTILKHLLALPNIPLNKVDDDGYSELRYAVSSGDIDIIKMLLDAGATVHQASQIERQPSLLAHAVTMCSQDSVDLLLERGCLVDEDTVYNRPSPLMLSIIYDQPSILQKLIDRGRADVNQPSNFFYNDQVVAAHPLFAASSASSSLFKILLDARADPNAKGPTKNACKEMQDTSVFSFNVKLKKADNIKLLLEAGVDLNSVDKETRRTLFTQIFLSHCDKNAFWSDIYNLVYKQYSGKHVLDVNLRDPITSQTPLEIAIHNNQLDLVKHLIELGVDPNVEHDNASNQQPVNALFQCASIGNFDAMELIYTRCPYILWSQQDRHGHTLVSFLVTKRYPYVCDISTVIKKLATAIGDGYKDIFSIPDNEGYTPTEYAAACGCQQVYQTFLDLGMPPAEKQPIISTVFTCQPVHYISLQAVEEDAEAEREQLQARRDAIKSSQDNDTTMEDEKIPVDPLSGLQDVGDVVDDYDITIMKIDVTQSAQGCNMFYKVSIIHNRILDLYVLWTRWGTFGEDGWTQKTPFQDKNEAVNEFKSIFRTKTGNHWDERNTNFVSKPGKFELIKARITKDVIITPSDFDATEDSVKSNLSRGVLQVMRMLCSFDNINRGYRNLEMELPVGQIPQKSIDQAMAILKRLESMVTRYTTMGTTVTTTEKQISQRQLIYEIGQETNAYYRLLPRPSDTNDGGIRPMLNHYVLKREMSRLLEIGYVNFSANVLLAAKYRSSEIHHLDYAYRALGCQLTEIRPQNDVSLGEYQMVDSYIQSTSVNCRDIYELVNLFKVNREEEDARYSPFKNNHNRKLLWHGSSVDNYMGILNQGLLCKPPRARGSGSMFGDGIYFADMFCKSVNYCRSAKHPAYSILLLCEVALGEEAEMTSYVAESYQPETKGHLSVKGLGKSIPNPANMVFDEYGVKIPLGPPIAAPTKLYYRLNFNEYIVYNPDQVKIRYLVTVRNKKMCSICGQKSASTPLDAHTFDGQTFDAKMNPFDHEVARMYLIHKNVTLQDLYISNLDKYVRESEQVDEKGNILEPLRRDSNVCGGCADDIMTQIWKYELLKVDENPIPEHIRTRPFCEELENCQNQYDVPTTKRFNAHSQQYRHWELTSL